MHAWQRDGKSSFLLRFGERSAMAVQPRRSQLASACTFTARRGLKMAGGPLAHEVSAKSCHSSPARRMHRTRHCAQLLDDGWNIGALDLSAAQLEACRKADARVALIAGDIGDEKPRNAQRDDDRASTA